MAIETEKMYELRKALKKLSGFHGSGTELISVYIPAGAQVHEMSNKLREELSQASNIKSKSTKLNVMGALEKIMGYLKLFRKPPPNGIAVFSGNTSTNAAKIDIEIFSLEPPQALNVGIYRCDSRFFLEPLERMLEVRDAYGVVVMDGREATLAYVKGTEIHVVKTLASLAHQKIRKGGQCLAAGTLIVKEDGGIINIEDFDKGERIIGLDFNKSKTIPAFASDFFITPAKHSFIIRTEAPSLEIRATPYHRFFVLSEYGAKEKFAKDLDQNDLVLIAKKINVSGDIEKVATFLSKIFDAEARLKKDCIEIVMSDEQLIKKIQLQLLRFGILSSFSQKNIKKRKQWRVMITDRNALNSFKESIGFTNSDKKEKLEKICNSPTKKQDTDFVPIDGREVFRYAQALSLKTSDFHAASCFFRNVKPLGREAFARNILPVFEKQKQSETGHRIYQKLQSILESDYTVACIREKIHVENNENFFDITVPVYSNFVANGFVVHNSSRRYQRLIEESIEKYYVRVGEAMDKYFLARTKSILLGGPGPTKDNFLKMKPYNYQHKVLGPVDTGYTDEYGIREVLAKSENLIAEQEGIKEKRLVDLFVKTVVSDGLATYGEKQVREAIISKQAEKVLISEGLPHTKAGYVCQSCNATEDRIVRDKPEEKIPCAKCGSEMKLKEEVSLIDELADLAKGNTIPVEIISTNTTEGAQFLNGFGGIGAFLRYRK